MHIHLVRHGQANAHGLNYDELTEHGYLQARKLGRRLHENGVRPEVFYRGSLKRHTQTLQGILEGLGLDATGSSIHELPGLNEIDPDTWKDLAKELAQKDASVASMLDQLREKEGPGRRRRLAALTGRVLRQWIQEQSASFLQFQTAVKNALMEAVSRAAEEHRSPVLLVSSGTPIALSIAAALEDERPEVIFHWLRHLGNTSHSILDFRHDRFQAMALNGLEHLTLEERTLM